MTARRPAPWQLTLLAVVAGYLVAAAIARLPAPDDRSLWVGNVAAPYVLLPLLAVLGMRRVTAPGRVRVGWSIAVGALTTAAMVAGFYRLVEISVTAKATEQDLAPGTSRASVLGTAYRRWIQNLVVGDPGGRPWVTVGLLTGAVVAAVGLRMHGRRRAGLVAAAALVVEPVVHAVLWRALPLGEDFHYPLAGATLVVAAVETACGIAVAVWALRTRSRPAGEPQIV